jgi:hypothetical protein
MPVKNLIKDFYLIFPKSKFELSIKLQNIGKLKKFINIINSVIVRFYLFIIRKIALLIYGFNIMCKIYIRKYAKL